MVVGVEYCTRSSGVNHFLDLNLRTTYIARCHNIPLLKIAPFSYLCNTFNPCGTSRVRQCMAPEVLLGGEYDSGKCAVWALGVVLYSMLCRSFPFERENDADGPGTCRRLFSRILSADFIPPNHVSYECLNLFSRIFVADPSQRLSLSELMQHPWFLESLPSGVLEMNDRLCQATNDLIDADVSRLISAAK